MIFTAIDGFGDEDDDEGFEDMEGVYWPDSFDELNEDPPGHGALSVEKEAIQFLMRRGASKVVIQPFVAYGLFTPLGGLQAVFARSFEPMSETGRATTVFVDPTFRHFTNDDLEWWAAESEDEDQALMWMADLRDAWLDEARRVRKRRMEGLQ